VEVDMPICSRRTVIKAYDKGDGNVAIDIETECESVRHFARLMTSATTEDLVDWSSSKVLRLAGETGLTMTCFVPTAVINCCWVELGMISKRLAMQKNTICMRFVD
jgi:hypothetical protein